jgi:[ribosomal protein S18]-alanine N-acetyltransferase
MPIADDFFLEFLVLFVEKTALLLTAPDSIRRRIKGKACTIACRYNNAVAIVLRDAQAKDFEDLWRIDQQCFPAGISYSRQELKFYMRRQGSFTLVAEDTKADRMVGFIVVHDGAAGHIITIDVIPTARRSGVGSMLLEAAEDRLHAAGSRAVDLETAVDNAFALSFYKRHGYHVIRTWPRYYSNGVDALVLRKNLGSLSRIHD